MADPEPKLREIFSKAAECQTPGEQAEFLDKACQGDVALRARLEELLQAHREADSFLQEPSAFRAATIAEPSSTERLGTLIGPYKLLQQIGEGGMGTVYMAEQTKPVQRKVALKVIKPGMDSRQVIARFEAERQALAMMDHVNIARVFDGGTTEAGRPYFVMELVHGIPITKYCDDNQLTPRERLELFVPVCHAIQHAHQKGIIHRDLKPSNVMITLYDGKPVPKVIDFGVAKATEQKLTELTLFTQYGTMVGTLEYMSPEQAEMSALGVDTRSDIYSLGVLLYELLTGSTPLKHKTMTEAAYAEILRMIKEEEPPKPSTRLSDSGEALASISANRHTEPAKLTKLVRGELDWIVMKTLEKDRNRRYETANGLAMDVQRYLSDETVQACPPSAWYRFRKFARRNKRPVLVIAMILLALVGGVIGTTWGMMRAEHARGLAEEERDEKDKARQLAETNEKLALKAHDAERLALAGEIKQRQRAEGNAKLATAVLDEIILKEARQRLTLYTQDKAKGVTKSPEREKLEWEFLEKGLKFYEQLAQTNATDWTARRERAKAYANVGLLRAELKNYVESEKAFRQAIQLAEVLAAERPQDFDARYDLAYNCHWLYGPCYDNRRFAAAEAAARQALVLFEKLAADFPDRSRFVQEHIAYIHGNLGRALDASGRPEEAAKAFRQSVVLYEKLAAQFPDQSSLYQEHKAYGHRNLGQVLAKSAKPQEAEQSFQASIAIWSELATAHPKAAGYRHALAYDYHLLANLNASQKRFADADTAYKIAKAGLKKLIAELDDPEYRSRLGGILLLWAFSCKADGRLKEAERIFREAAIEFEALQTNFPKQSRWAIHELGYIYLFLGQLLFGLDGREQDAEKAYLQSVAYHEKQLAQDPENREYQERMTWSYSGLARLLRKTSRPLEASQLDAKRIDLVKKLASTANLAHEMNNLAWNLAVDPDPQLRDPAQAVELAKKAVALAPTQGGYWNTLGTAHYRAGSWQAAIEALRKASELYQGRSFSHNAFFLAMGHWQLGEKQRARKWYALALVWMEKHAPKNEELLRFRAEAASLLGLPKELTPEQELTKADDVKFYTLVLEADPKMAWAYGLRGSSHAQGGQWKEAAADFARAIELKKDDPLPHYRQALVRLHLGDVAGYRKLCADMLGEFGKSANADASFWTVWTCALAPDAVTDWQPVVQMAEKLLAGDPKNCDKLQQLGAVLYRAGRFKDAAKRLTEAEAAFKEAKDPRSSLVYCWLFQAMTQHRLSHAEESQRWLEKAMKEIEQPSQKGAKDSAARPWNRKLTLQLLRAEAESPEETDRKRDAYFTEIIEQRANDPASWIARGRFFESLGQSDRATDDFFQAFKLGLDEPQLLLDGARFFLGHGQHERALQVTKRLLEKEPRNGHYWHLLGEIHYRAKDWKAALAGMQKAIEVFPSSSSWQWFYLALAHWQLGEQDEAKNWYNRAVRWMDKNEPHREQLRRLRAETEKLLGIQHMK